MLRHVCCLLLVLHQTLAWESLPQLPSGRRSQYFLLNGDGGYKYGYDTGSGSFAKQLAAPNNEVEGHYAYPVGDQLVDVKYKSGIGGFQIENANLPQPSKVSVKAAATLNSYLPPKTKGWSAKSSDSFDGPSDASYSFSYNTGDASRQESSDAPGKINGRYSYTNDAHDLSYVAGSDTGFMVTGGSLATPNSERFTTKTSGSWASKSSSPTINSGSWNTKSSAVETMGPSDGSYSFSYNAGDSSRQESADASGNVKGRYSYTNDAGQHDLSYVAGSDTGFMVTGGSLATPNKEGFATKSSGSWASKSSAPAINSESWATKSVDSNEPSDGSYSFSYNAGDSSRQESADASGNVKGRYSYTNDAGQHDLSYVAGSDTGFMVTGGSLASPNKEGFATKSSGSWKSSAPAVNSESWATKSADSNEPSDGSYSFSYNAGDSSRQESADASGNVKGRYSYTNDAGQHDLSYVAGSDTGFMVTGGSLATPNKEGFATKSSGSWESSAPAVNSESWATKSADSNEPSDGSYSFSYNAGDSTRQESADASGNVKGRYSYTNDAGQHDLSYVAGSDTGFMVTGGSLASPNKEGFATKSSGSWKSSAPAVNSESWATKSADSNEPSDGSYSFSYNAGDSSRQESADASGNVKGRYSYTNDAGQHDLSYVAGSDTGFMVTGGSLATPNKEGFATKSSGSWESSAPVVNSESWATKSADSNEPSDGSYSFSYNAGDSSRQESADASGNVKGRYSYTNDAGQHDLSYVAGSDTGFMVTGGSLATPNTVGFASKSSGSWASKSSAPVASSESWATKSAESNEPSDGSYSFSYNAGDSSRQESADASGNVKGRYSYTNDAGQHDLHYSAGAGSGFKVTGGSLASPNGLKAGKVATKSNIASVSNSWATKSSSNLQSGSSSSGKISYTLGNGVSKLKTSGADVLVLKYLPVQENSKYGYIFDTQ